MVYTLFVSCPRGLEGILAQELQAQNCQKIHPLDGGVSCSGGLAEIYRINLHSRTAGRVLLQLAKSPYHHEQDIYKLSKSINWTKWFNVEQTFKVKLESKKANLKSLDFTALKIKDAVCDVFRDATSARPSVDKMRPDVRIHAFVDSHWAQIFIDTSGEALFKRGYRTESGEAPLRENLSAGLLLLSGYDGSQDFQDPFCGSGTLAIEASLIALNCPSGYARRFGFEKLANFDKALWVKIKADAQTKMLAKPRAKIWASDHDHAMTKMAQLNARMAETENFIDFETADVLDTRPNGQNGILISNPPYGVRLAEIQALHALYPQLGTWLKHHYAGWQIGWLTADRDMPKLMRLQPKRKIPLFNGNLDCRLFLLDMVQGSNR